MVLSATAGGMHLPRCLETDAYIDVIGMGSRIKILEKQIEQLTKRS